MRRQALTAQGIEDKTRYVSTELLSKRHIIPNATYYNAMLFQVEDLRKLPQQTNPWPGMSANYSYLQETIDRVWSREEAEKGEIKNKILQLYACYVREWDVAAPIIGQEFLGHKDIA